MSAELCAARPLAPPQSDMMARGLHTGGPPATDDLLKQLNVDFQRSKTEQIQRFLHDQESLNRKFAEYDLHSEEEEDDGSGGSDTESVYSQRMALYKARPESVLGGITLDQLFNKDDDAASNTSTSANFSDSDDEKHRHGDRNRNVGNARGTMGAAIRSDRRGREEMTNGHDVNGKTPGRLEKKLLVRRHVRPRTATGITSVKSPPEQNVISDLLGEKKRKERVKPASPPQGDRLPDATPRPLRASAPAATRTRPTLESDVIEKDHVVERSAARKTLLRDSKPIGSYRDAFGGPTPGGSTSRGGVTVPDINNRGDRKARPSYSRLAATSSRHHPTSGDTGDTHAQRPVRESRDPRTSGISSGNTRLSQSRHTSSYQAVPDSRATRTVHRVGSTNVSSVHNQRDSSVESRSSRTSVLRIGETPPAAAGGADRRRDGFRGSSVRQTSRDRERSRERRIGVTSTRVSTAAEAFQTQETSRTSSNRHVTVLKLPPLDGGGHRSARAVSRDQPV